MGLGRYHPLAQPYWRVVILHNPLLRLLFTGMYDFILHEAYWLLAALRYRMRGAPAISNSALRSMRERGFAIVKTDLRNLASFWEKFDRFQYRHKPGDRPAMPVLFKGMLSVPAISDNQVFVDQFSKEEVDSIARFAKEAGIEEAVRHFFGCNVSCYNIRAWRYFPHASLKQDRHRDNLPPHGLKVMCFRGKVDRARGALSVQDYRGEWHVIEGEDVAVIFDSNRLPHESASPGEGNWRDCIELTYMPEAGPAPRYQASGPEAEHPVNPFSDWTVPAREAVAYKRLWYRSQRSIGR